MIPEAAFNAWIERSHIRANYRALSKGQLDQARGLFSELAPLTPAQVRSRLASADAGGNRRLAVCLLDRALDLFVSGNAEQAIGLGEWSRFAAQFGDALNQKSDCVEPDAAFLIAAARHQGEPSQQVWERYSEAAGLYEAAQADSIQIALSLFAQGWVALEAGLLESANSAYRGSRELFDTALAKLPPAAPVRETLGQLIDQGMRQSDAIDSAALSAQPLAALRASGVPIDQQLTTMLRARTRMLSGMKDRENPALVLARLHDRLAAPEGGGMRMWLAKQFLGRKRPRPAEEIVRELMRESPGDAALTEALAGAIEQQGRFAEARPLFEELTRMQPGSAEYHGRLGMLCLAMNDRPAAARELRQSLQIDPSNSLYADALRTLEPALTVHFKDGQMVIAGDTSAAAPDDLAAAMTVAIIAEHPETMAESLATLDQRDDTRLADKVRRLLQQRGLLEAPPEPPGQMHLAAAEQHFQYRRFEDAIAEYGLAIAADEDLAPAYLGLGDAYYSTGKYYLAAAYFEESIEVQPDASAWRFLGDCHRNVGRRKKAIEAYKHALELRPDYSGARTALQELESSQEGA